MVIIIAGIIFLILILVIGQADKMLYLSTMHRRLLIILFFSDIVMASP